MGISLRALPSNLDDRDPDEYRGFFILSPKKRGGGESDYLAVYRNINKRGLLYRTKIGKKGNLIEDFDFYIKARERCQIFIDNLGKN